MNHLSVLKIEKIENKFYKVSFQVSEEDSSKERKIITVDIKPLTYKKKNPFKRKILSQLQKKPSLTFPALD